MARPFLPSTLVFSSVPLTLFSVILAVISVFSLITFLCGSEKLKKFHIETEKATRSKAKLNSNLGNRALSMVKMLSWRKVEAEAGAELQGDNYSDHDHDHDHDDDQALWRKNILMGEKCRPLNFSGKIDNHSQP